MTSETKQDWLVAFMSFAVAMITLILFVLLSIALTVSEPKTGNRCVDECVDAKFNSARGCQFFCNHGGPK